MRISANGLVSGQAYAVRIRSIGPDKKTSAWSPKLNFTTTTDSKLPKAPTNVTWTATGNDFTGRWDAVTKNLNNRDVVIIKYEIRLTAGNGDVRRDSVTAGSDDIGVYNLSHRKNRNLFGNARRNITFEVRAVDNKDLKSAWSAPINVNINDPQPVTNVTVTGELDALVVKWDASTSPDVVTYNVHVGTSANFTVSTANRFFQGFTTAAIYRTATYAPHYVAVVAVDAMGLTSAPVYAGPATPASPFVLDTTPPSVPTGLAVSASAGAPPIIATLSWTFDATAEGNTSLSAFVVQWRKVGDTTWYSEFIDKDLRSAAIELPVPYADYEFKIAAVDGVGNWSDYSSVVTLSNSVPGPPPTPTGILADAGMESVALSWTQSTHNDVVYGGYYEVNIATNSAFTTGLLSYKTGNNYISVSGLSMDTVHYYRIRAVDSTALTSAWSTTAQFTTLGIDPPEITDGLVPASSPAAVVTAGIGVLHVSWAETANSDIVTYEVHMSTTSGFAPGPATLVAKTPGTIVTLKRDAAGASLAYGTTYYVKLRATDADGPATAYGTQGSGSPVKAGTGDITTIIADQIGTGSLGAAVVTVATGGEIRSADYNGSTAGWKLANNTLDIRSGTVAVGTLLGGTISSKTINIGASGVLNIDSTGIIKSNNYALNSTGWKLDSAGLEMNSATIRNATIISPSITAGGTTINSAGITGSGFTLSGSALSITAGTINGPAVYTNTLRSNTTNAYTQSGYNFSINQSGYTEIAGLKVYGNTIVGNSSAHWIQSGDWVSGSAGWKLQGDGYFEVNRGVIAGATIRTGPMTNHWAQLYGTGGIGYLQFMYGSNTVMGGIGAASILHDGLIIYGMNGIGGSGRIEMRNGAVDVFGNLNLQGNSLYGINTIGAGGNVNFNGTLTMLGPKTIAGGPTIEGGLNIGAGGGITGGGGMSNFGGVIQFASLADGGSNNTNTGGKYVRATPNGTLHAHTTAPSSRDIKHDIKPLEMDWMKVLELEPVTFRYNWSPDEVRVGFVAENARDLGLGVLTTYEDPENSDKVTGFDYDGFGAVLLLVAQEQERRIAFLEQKITQLQGKE